MRAGQQGSQWKKNSQRAREGGIVCYINQSKQTTHVLQLAPQDHASQHTAWHDMAWHGNPTEARGGNTGWNVSVCLSVLSIWVCYVFHCCPVCQWSPYLSEHSSYFCRIHLQFNPGGKAFCLTRWQSVERSKVQPHFTFLSKRQQVLLSAVFNAVLHLNSWCKVASDT